MSELYRAKMLVMRTEFKLNEVAGTEIELARHNEFIRGVQQVDRVTVFCTFLNQAPRVGEMLEVVIHDASES